ncbi:MAG TPA: cupin-like domain-containing protein, partial [Sphingomonas sp.]
ACVVAGRRRFTLFPPSQVANLYVGPLEHTISGQPVSMVDLDAPDFDRFPRFADAQQSALIADLDPGDALYVPSLWWHHVKSAERFNLLVNYWWSEERDGSAFECLIHGLLAIRDLPERERESWRAFFDHFVFRPPPDAVAHLPVEACGVLGPRSPARTNLIREFLLRALTRRR